MQPLEVEIEDVAAGGDGIAHAPDGRVVFVDGAIPGDIVSVALTEDRPRMLRGVIDGIVEPSDDRIAPPCPYVATGCGGCGWQHVTVDAQRRLKVRIAEEALRRIGRIEHAVTEGPPLPAEGYRTNVRCLIVDGRAAFRAARSHDPVPVDRCMVAHPGIDALIAGGRFGGAQEVVLRIGGATGDRLVIIDPTVGADVELPDDVVVVGRDDLASGASAAYTERVRDQLFRVSAESFFQTRTDGAQALVDAVETAGAGYWGSGRLLDLFGGVGLFARCLGEGMSVTVVEGSRSSAADAIHNLAGLDATVTRVSAQRWKPAPADIVVADPPRAGLGADVVSRVVATGAARVVLVSCDAASYGRDSRLLSDAGFHLRSTTSIDLFPHTPHVELVSSFDREIPT